jgi:hypothetical protein
VAPVVRSKPDDAETDRHTRSQEQGFMSISAIPSVATRTPRDPATPFGFLHATGLGYRFSFASGVAGRIDCIDAEGRLAGSVSVSDHVSTIPCFTPDCLVETENGQVPVGKLSVGDLLVTCDNGLQPLRWKGSRTFDWRILGLNPLLNPVRISSGSLGHGLPSRDLLLSPNHRILPPGTDIGREMADNPGLTQVRDLLDHDGISRDICHEVTYIQLLCDRQELLKTEGIWCESFVPTASSCAGFEVSQKESLEHFLTSPQSTWTKHMSD